jgi:glycosyltransferase involved in cell wall biosynthesis
MLFIGTFLSKQRGTKGIAESLAESLSKKNISVKLVSNKENKFLRIIEISCAILFTKITKVHIDVFSGSSFRISELAVNLSTFRNKKIYLTLHGGKLPEFYENNEKRFENLFRKASLILTPSKYIQKFFIENGFSINYLPNSINTNAFPFQWKQPSVPKILWVRGFTEIYNPELAILSLLIVRKEFPNATLTMIGPDLGLLDKMKEIVSKNELIDVVHFIGAIPNTELYKYYNTHSVFINTTSYESFGMAVLEAACCGIPIVSSPVGEIPLLWNAEKEILISEDLSIQNFSNCILKILKNHDFAINISKNAIVKSEQFSIEKILPQWITLIEDNTIN